MEKHLIGQRIKHLRSQLGLTQDQLAELVGISPKYLSNIERGRENPTLDTLLRLAASLKVEMWEMFLHEPEKQSPKLLKEKIKGLVSEAREEQLQLVVKLLRAVIH